MRKQQVGELEITGTLIMLSRKLQKMTPQNGIDLLDKVKQNEFDTKHLMKGKACKCKTRVAAE